MGGISFDQLGLGVELLKAVDAMGYSVPTPIQARAIPRILAGGDVLARAQTGTGKTEAFGLPLVEMLSREGVREKHPRALILAPTRELALQVGESIKTYARRVSLRCTVVHGGVRINPQADRLKRGIDILVATPGRLLDLVDHGKLNLSRIAFLVFDEADRMLDLGFSEEISEVLNLVPAKRRTMLFSATYTPQIRDLAGRMLENPEYIEVSLGNSAADSVDQKVHLVERSNKRGLLLHLLSRGGESRVLVFVRTKHGANKLTEKLAVQGISVAALHSNKSQSFRTRTLEAFKNGEIRVLVATDVAARGLDISDLPLVVNYDMPGSPEAYVHRIGRTGRAGGFGLAVSLVSADEKQNLEAVETLLKRKLPVEEVDGYTEGRDVPDFVLFRPGKCPGEKKADSAITAPGRRSGKKKRPKPRPRKKTGAAKGSGPASKSVFAKKRGQAGKKRAGRSRVRSG